MVLRLRAVVAACLVLLLPSAGLAALPSAASAEPAPSARSFAARAASGERERALQALERAQQLLRGDSGSRRAGAHADATLVLRDLALQVGALPRDRQRVARAILARPTEGLGSGYDDGYQVESQARCTANVCVHWVPSTADAPPPRDDNGDRVPDWVQTTSATLEEVWRRVVGGRGYRPPRSDVGSSEPGPDDRLDVYLADLGAQGLYGYCTTDDPEVEVGRWNVSAYCVLDDDFSTAQFAAPPLHSLRVTAAHELFHAVQFGYDVTEDLWLMEGTATWMEDEVYDGIDDNLQFLWQSPLTEPSVSLDRPRHRYGAWVFWRFLGEHLGRGGGTDPTVVRQVWERAAASGSRPGAYSLQAVGQTLAARGRSFRKVFAEFGAANRVARRWYDEGRKYPQAAATGQHRLRRDPPGTGWRARTLDHLTNQHVVFRPTPSLAGRWRLRVTVDLPPWRRGSMATVQVHRRDGRVRWHAVRLNGQGNGAVTLPFARASVSRVGLTLTNASARYRCGQVTWLACQGTSLDDRLRFRYSARALPPRR